MKALDRKALRDLKNISGMVLVIALMIACGVATYVMSLSSYDSLRITRDAYYKDYRFSDVFASLKRAPDQVKSRIREIDGVQQVETRVVAMANIEIPGFNMPVRGQLISLPDEGGQPQMNQLFIRRGRIVDPQKDNEVIISEPFADAHNLEPGNRMSAIINGRRKQLTIVGIALSPEYVMEIGPGAVVPDYKLYGILWMARSPLASAYDMEGAFNNVTLTLNRGAREEDVIDRLDLILEPYGGLGAYGQADQTSNFYLSEEFNQLKIMATVLPLIFMGVAAFLLNIAIGRLVRSQREEIAVLKAFGYSNLEVGLHFIKMVTVIVIIGIIAGIAFGAYIGNALSGLYKEFYRFPYLEYHLEPYLVVSSALISFAAAFAGVIFAVRSAVLLPPAEAMRPERPAVYRKMLLEWIGLGYIFDQPTRMIIRNLERRPLKAFLSIIGISLAGAIVMLGQFAYSSVDFIVDAEFRRSQRDDLHVTFSEPASRKALYELNRLPGVYYAEPYRSAQVRLRHTYHTYRTGIQGIPENSELRRLLDTDFNVIHLPQSGLVLTDNLAKNLDLQEGDTVQVEVLEGKRSVSNIPVVRLIHQYFGLAAYMDLDALNRFMQEQEVISGAYLSIDSKFREDIYEELNRRPRVVSVTYRQQLIQNFYDAMAENWLIMSFFISMFAAATAFSVIYNNARIALSERSRELASLRILGFTRGEISYILIGELVVLGLLSIPIGFFIGWWLTAYIVYAMQTDLYSLPLIVASSTYALSALIVIVSTVIAGVIVKLKLNRLDLIAVLKTRE